jgi:hypothetical protein
MMKSVSMSHVSPYVLINISDALLTQSVFDKRCFLSSQIFPKLGFPRIFSIYHESRWKTIKYRMRLLHVMKRGAAK